jgi:hypothetical protein
MKLRLNLLGLHLSKQMSFRSEVLPKERVSTLSLFIFHAVTAGCDKNKERGI